MLSISLFSYFCTFVCMDPTALRALGLIVGASLHKYIFYINIEMVLLTSLIDQTTDQ